MAISFPPGASEGAEVTLDNVTYTLKNGVWKAEVYYYDLDELDEDHVNVFGDNMSGNLLEAGDTFPGVDDSTGTKINFSGNVRVDSMVALPNENPIQLITLVDGNGDSYSTGLRITGKPFFNYSLLVDSPSTVTSFVVPAGQDVTRAYQWQQAITDTTPTADGYNVVLPTDADFSDIAGATDTNLKVTEANTGFVYNDEFPNKTLFIRCVETVTDSRGNVCLVGGVANQSCALVSTSQIIGPITPTRDI